MNVKKLAIDSGLVNGSDTDTTYDDWEKEIELFAQKIIAARDAEWMAEPVAWIYDCYGYKGDNRSKSWMRDQIYDEYPTPNEDWERLVFDVGKFILTTPCKSRKSEPKKRSHPRQTQYTPLGYLP